MLLQYLQPSIEVWNIRVDEPITAATDLLLACISHVILSASALIIYKGANLLLNAPASQF